MNEPRTHREHRWARPDTQLSNKGNFMTASVPRRRPPKVDTKRAEAKRACARHLEDFRRAHEEPPESVPPHRRPKIDTERAAAKRACARHLKDLRRAHEEPPADVAVST